MASAVAYRYAQALADIVMEARSAVKPDDAVTQLRAVEALIWESADLRIALETPAIPPSRKRAVMGKLMERSGASLLIRNFVYVLINHRRIALISEVREAFESKLDERMGMVRAEVSSAAPLTTSQSASVEAELAHLTGKRMRLRFEVDPSLVGGIVARIGSTVYDGSVRGELAELGRKLAASSVE